MLIVERKGRPHVFTLKDGVTFRIFPYQSVEVSDSNISNEMEIAYTKGLISKTPVVKKKRSPKKLGGTKNG